MNLNCKLVNWIAGMDVSDNHFRQMENFFVERLCDNQANRLTRHNYGLLPASEGSSSEFDISEIITGNIEIKLRRCNALTAGGCRICYNPENSGNLIYNHSFDAEKREDVANTQYWDVILSIDPYRRMPTGTPDEEETPPRHPYTTEFYRLSIAPEGRINRDNLGLHHLVIGRVRQRSGRFEVDTNYIPPCTSMSSHADLLDYYGRFGVCLNDMERASKLIVAKIRNRTQNSPLAEHICSMCREMMRYIASIYFAYRNKGRDAAPVDIVNYFSTLAHTAYVSLNFISKTDREELLQYFYEWSDVNPGSFEDMLSKALGIIYEHDNIRTVMLQLETFLKTISELWIKLSTLEYIGKHKDNVVISERVHQTEPVKTKSDWSILD